MSSTDRVMAAIEFRPPDRLPQWDNLWIFGTFTDRWRRWKGVGDDVNPTDYYSIDISMVMPVEEPFPSKSGVVGRKDGYELFRDGWGRIVKQKPGDANFMMTVQSAVSNRRDLDRLSIEDPGMETRYQEYVAEIDRHRKAGRLAFTKIGGIYCRSQFMRQEEQLLMDMAMDEGFCHALFSRVADHLTQIGLEAMRRTNSWDTGIWIYDDSASSSGPMFSPAMWERYLLPLYTRMIDTFREAGCKHFFFHSDGNIGPLIDLLLGAGFEGFNPLEPRCGLDLFELRERYGEKVVFFGGICNTCVLPGGNEKEIESMVRRLIELGRTGGLVIGSASIGDDILPETYDFYMRLLQRHANYSDVGD